ncbi:MAG: ammonia-forming cytochrome c nitrite reductase subunit c552, partial [Candidatus Sumerlaeota bacterium]|nr:ammonia-forming cytochrome c nitrite reductase subunit c552 [Candidatus Sumerlaeota bacterium]
QLDCLHCHTSSGRYRFKESEANQACLPCHEDRVKNVAAHSHHKADGPGVLCVSCHMPQTEFARMRRTDHSMRPPTPAATLAFKSPNACNLCHSDKDAAWADRYARQWQTKDYQAPVLQRAGLIDAARRGDWRLLPEMLAYLARGDRDEVFSASLIRLLAHCPSAEKAPSLIRGLKDASPLVRASAAQALGSGLFVEAIEPLASAARDDTRLVRIRAAEALAGAPLDMIPEAGRPALQRAAEEFVAAMRVRPDDSISHYNLGNFLMARNEAEQAAKEFETAIRLMPENLPALVNVSLAYNQMGDNDRAEACLRQALKLDPASAAASLNLGLLLGEQGRNDEAIAAFREALKRNPKSDTAAYNLGILLAEKRPKESLELLRQAVTLRRDDAKYIYSLAFYCRQNGRVEEAIELMNYAIEKRIVTADMYSLLGEIYLQTNRKADAASVYRLASENKKLPEATRAQFRQKWLSIKPSQK